MDNEWHSHIKKHGKYRSGFEKQIADTLKEAGVMFRHEPEGIPYKNNTGSHYYYPDFVVRLKDGTRVFLEVKGYMPLKDSCKMQSVKTLNPDTPIWFVFQNGKTKVGQRKSTNMAWAKRHGFPAAEKTIPPEWLEQFMTKEEWKAREAANDNTTTKTQARNVSKNK